MSSQQQAEPGKQSDGVRSEGVPQVGTPGQDDLERLEEASHAAGHGTSVAAWTATGGVMAGGIVVTLAMIFFSPVGILIGSIVMVLGALSGPVLARAGYGEKVSNREYTGGPRAVR